MNRRGAAISLKSNRWNSIPHVNEEVSVSLSVAYFLRLGSPLICSDRRFCLPCRGNHSCELSPIAFFFIRGTSFFNDGVIFRICRGL